MPTETKKDLVAQGKAEAAAAERARVEKAMTDSLVKLLPRQVDPARFTAFALAIMRSPDLRECTEQSKMLALSDCAKMGLFPDPNLGHVYLVPFNNKYREAGGDVWRKEVTVIIGYQGMIELARRSKMITAVHSFIVREGDEFTHWIDEDGPHVRHVPELDISKPISHAYCIAKLTSGEKQIEVMPIAEVEKHRARSKAKDSGPWKTDYPAMVRKTPIRVGRKFWPQSPELAFAGALDDVADDLYERKHVDNVAAGALSTAPTGRLDTRPDPQPPVEPQWEGPQGSGPADPPKTETKPTTETKPDGAQQEQTGQKTRPEEQAQGTGTSTPAAEPPQATEDAIPASAEGRHQWLARVAMKSTGWDDEPMAMAIMRRWLMTNQVAPSSLNKDAVFNPAREKVEVIDWKPAFDEYAAAAEKAAADKAAADKK